MNKAFHLPVWMMLLIFSACARAPIKSTPVTDLDALRAATENAIEFTLNRSAKDMSRFNAAKVLEIEEQKDGKVRVVYTADYDVKSGEGGVVTRKLNGSGFLVRDAESEDSWVLKEVKTGSQSLLFHEPAIINL